MVDLEVKMFVRRYYDQVAVVGRKIAGEVVVLCVAVDKKKVYASVEYEVLEVVGFLRWLALFDL